MLLYIGLRHQQPLSGLHIYIVAVQQYSIQQSTEYEDNFSFAACCSTCCCCVLVYHVWSRCGVSQSQQSLLSWWSISPGKCMIVQRRTPRHVCGTLLVLLLVVLQYTATAVTAAVHTYN